jgi:hypothetical protein
LPHIEFIEYPFNSILSDALNLKKLHKQFLMQAQVLTENTTKTLRPIRTHVNVILVVIEGCPHHGARKRQVNA